MDLRPISLYPARLNDRQQRKGTAQMKRGVDPKTHVDLGRLCAVFDAADVDKALRTKTLDDVVRVYDGEIKPVTVYRNLARRIEAAKQERLAL